MPRAIFTNNARTTLAAGISAAATAITVVDGSVFPSPSAGDWAYLTLENGADIEIVKLTARSGNNLTIQRAQDGTTAKSFTTAATVSLRLIKAVLDEIHADIAAAALTAAWGSISGKPSTFAPSAHTHPISDITSLQTTLDGKADLSGAAFTGVLSVGGNTVYHAGNFGKTQIDALNINADTVDGKHVGTSGDTIPVLNVSNTWSNWQQIAVANSLPFRIIRSSSTGAVGIRFQNDAGHLDFFGVPTGAGVGNFQVGSFIVWHKGNLTATEQNIASGTAYTALPTGVYVHDGLDYDSVGGVGAVLTAKYTDLRMFQLAVPGSAVMKFRRAHSSNGFEPWRTIWHDGNDSPLAKLAGGTFTGGIGVTSTTANPLTVTKTDTGGTSRITMNNSADGTAGQFRMNWASQTFGAWELWYPFNNSSAQGLGFSLGKDICTIDVPLRARPATASGVSGSLSPTNHANRILTLSGNITLPSAAFTEGDVGVLDPNGSAWTITRGSGLTMYVNGSNVASATTSARGQVGFRYASSSVVYLSGDVS